MAEKVESMREPAETELTEGEELEKKNEQMKERKVSWAKLRRVDSLNLEAGRVTMSHHHGSQVSYGTVLFLLLEFVISILSH